MKLGRNEIIFQKTTILKKYLSHTITLSIALLLFMCVAHAQTCIIKGKVKDGEISLEYATVSMAGKTKITNANGEFSIAIQPGIYTIIITHVGYKKIEQHISVNSSLTLGFNMSRDEQMGE